MVYEEGSLIYHYTPIQGLMGIVEDSQIHFANGLFLNDSKEFYFIIERSLKYLEDIALLEQDSKVKRLIIEAFHEVSNIVHSPERKTMPDAFYLSSFSIIADDLSQWRGYCLGFSREELESSLHTYWALEDVEYCKLGEDPPKLRAFFATFIDILESYRQKVTVLNVLGIDTTAILWLNNVCKPARLDDTDSRQFKVMVNELSVRWYMHIIDHAPLFKDISFQAEREVRLFTTVSTDVQFKVSGNTLKPYRKFELAPMKKYLKTITISPSSTGVLDEIGLNFFLVDRQLPIEPLHSEIPFRSSH